MESRPIGQSGVSVSTVGLGGYELGPEVGEEPNVDRAVAVIEAALEAGVDWLDTSENCLDTRNESLIGAALGQIRGEFLVATKAAPSAGVTGGGTGFRRHEIRAACRASLRRLGRDQIDIYFLHWPDDTGVPPCRLSYDRRGKQNAGGVET
jgi:1-deoxyxylulose-5-phosphate synthase